MTEQTPSQCLQQLSAHIKKHSLDPIADTIGLLPLPEPCITEIDLKDNELNTDKMTEIIGTKGSFAQMCQFMVFMTSIEDDEASFYEIYQNLIFWIAKRGCVDLLEELFFLYSQPKYVRLSPFHYLTSINAKVNLSKTFEGLVAGGHINAMEKHFPEHSLSEGVDVSIRYHNLDMLKYFLDQMGSDRLVLKDFLDRWVLIEDINVPNEKNAELANVLEKYGNQFIVTRDNGTLQIQIK